MSVATVAITDFYDLPCWYLVSLLFVKIVNHRILAIMARGAKPKAAAVKSKSSPSAKKSPATKPPVKSESSALPQIQNAKAPLATEAESKQGKKFWEGYKRLCQANQSFYNDPSFKDHMSQLEEAC